ncbi:photosystem reaction center subunit H [Paracoccus acridae]|uniref:Photosystem reaction center subunit H n=1 Tax=Paracoccus acridae TaxID=1795310 RepID=A0ABQ1VIT1_9RHOB|nr:MULTISPECIES: PRC-barrel domain-containing protein [Paracoccus]MDQ1898834.1 PRC-barrel domain-containing protein [Paracoccus sp. WLY502]GGF71106.1 photosystem reaction center subunit H [Paracoccus acridae]
MDHSQHPRLLPDELTDAVLTGASVYGPGDQTIGSVSHVHGSGSNAQVVIDVGGFLGIGSKPVLVPVSDLDVMRDGDGVVHAVSRWSKEDLKALPEHRD